jgi:NosR/NirI family transcriptional regulator, nitrous oxide reductase regulator
MQQSWRHWCIHLGRVAVLACILILMHLQHAQMRSSLSSASSLDFDVAQVRSIFPKAALWGDPNELGGRWVNNEVGERIGYVVQTAPESDPYLGFSGPSNLLIAFDVHDQIAGIKILSSQDTRDHVELIRNSSRFFAPFIGLKREQAASLAQLDGVAGATLTSVAMVQGIQKRLGGSVIVAKFAKPMELADVQSLFVSASRLEQDRAVSSLWHVYDPDNQLCGSVLRTSPAADTIIGYQGPTETRIALSPNGSIVGLSIGDSYDNEPYVGYVRGDAGFLEMLKKFDLDQWSRLDLKSEGIEGVSGATMTSIAVAQGIVQAARRLQEDKRAREALRIDWLRHIGRHAGTAMVVMMGMMIGLTSLRGNTLLRKSYQFVLVVYLGLICGDLVSMAMFVGWAHSGVPWRNAIGLVVLSIAAISLPIVAKTNIYCSHLCPHGAVQQLLPRRWRATNPIPKSLRRVLEWVRPALLIWVVVVGMLSLPFSLVDIEPFDAYAWRAAAWPTMTVALVGIVCSLRVPMAYCRFGCPTGAVLNYVRRHAKSDRLTIADGLALGCLAVSLALYLIQVSR